MKKGLEKFIICFVIVCLILTNSHFNVQIFADELQNENGAYIYENEILPEWQETIDSAPIKSEEFIEMSILDMLYAIFNAAKDNFFGPLTLFASLCAAMIIVSAIKSISESNKNSTMFSFLDSISAIFVFTLASSHLLSLFEVIKATMIDGEIYLKSFIPIFAGVLLSSGQVGASTIYSTVFFTMVNITSQILTGLVIPFARIILALHATGTIDNTINLNKLAIDAAKWLKWLLGAAATIFATVLSLQTVFAQTADSAAMKAGKFLIGTSVPVVGRAVSDALSSVFAGMKVVKGSIGFAAIAFIAAIFLPIIIQCVLYHISFSLSSLVAGAMGNVKMQSVLDGCTSCVGILIAIVLFFSLIVISSTLLMVVVGMGG